MRLYALFSFYLFVGSASALLKDRSYYPTAYEQVCYIHRGSPVAWYLITFYYTKYWEMQDVILWILLGNSPSLHFLIHHFTTPLVAIIGYLWGSLGLMTVAMILNTLLHSLLYFYLSIDRKPNEYVILFYLVRFFGFVQLIGVIVVYFWAGRCGGALWANGVALFFYFVYLTLFLYDIYLARKEKKRPLKLESLD